MLKMKKIKMAVIFGQWAKIKKLKKKKIKKRTRRDSSYPRRRTYIAPAKTKKHSNTPKKSRKSIVKKNSFKAQKVSKSYYSSIVDENRKKKDQILESIRSNRKKMKIKSFRGIKELI